MPPFRTTFAQTWSNLGRRMGTRKRTTEIFKTLVVVIPLTLLIWIYAERAQVTPDSVQVVLTPALSDPAFIPSIIEPANGQVTLDISGPRVLINQLKSELERRSMDRSLKLNLSAAYAHEGEQNAEVSQILTDDPMFKDSGVSINKSTPPLVRVSVSRVVTRDVVVVLPTDLPVALQNVIFEPKTVTVRGPDTIFDSGLSSVAVDLTNQAAGLTGSGTHTIEIPLASPKDRNVHLTPDRVKMTFEVGALEVDSTIRNVPIVVQKLASLDAKQIVVLKQLLIHNVPIRGPQKSISKLDGDNPSIHPSAVLRLDVDDGPQNDVNRPVEIIGLPPDVKATGPRITVDFDIKDSTTSGQ